jgi:MEDS: MEthanogen/methylotroph, DcmR Sensory domain
VRNILGSLPESNDKLAVEEFSDRLYFLPDGNHYFIFYSNLIEFRNINTSFIRKQLTEQPNSVVLFLSFYDTAENVQKLLEDLKDKSRLKVLDIVQVIRSNDYQVPDVERLGELAERTKKELEDKPLVVVADMSAFNHVNRSSELFEYEEKLHEQPKPERWKELCFYHKRDFDAMFTYEQKKRLFTLHKEIT